MQLRNVFTTFSRLTLAASCAAALLAFPGVSLATELVPITPAVAPVTAPVSSGLSTVGAVEEGATVARGSYSFNLAARAGTIQLGEAGTIAVPETAAAAGGVGTFAATAGGGALLFFGADSAADWYMRYREETQPRVRAWVNGQAARLWDEITGDTPNEDAISDPGSTEPYRDPDTSPVQITPGYGPRERIGDLPLDRTSFRLMQDEWDENDPITGVVNSVIAVPDAVARLTRRVLRETIKETLGPEALADIEEGLGWSVPLEDDDPYAVENRDLPQEEWFEDGDNGLLGESSPSGEEAPLDELSDTAQLDPAKAAELLRIRATVITELERTRSNVEAQRVRSSDPAVVVALDDAISRLEALERTVTVRLFNGGYVISVEVEAEDDLDELDTLRADEPGETTESNAEVTPIFFYGPPDAIVPPDTTPPDPTKGD